MIKHLPPYESEIATQLIDIAFGHSARAFSAFINTPVTMNATPVFEGNMVETSINSPVYVLQSELIGEIGGKCYLNFSRTDAASLCSTCLPEQYRNDTNMYSAILMELANIVTAAVVSMLADILKIESFAGVPEMNVIPSKELNHKLQSDFVKDQMVLHFKAGFHVAKLELVPEFIWVFDLMLAESINKFIHQPDHVEIIKNYSAKALAKI